MYTRGNSMARKPAALPPAAFAGITGILVLIVIGVLWQNAQNRPDLRGDWVSGGCEQLVSSTGDQASTKRRLQLTPNNWFLEQTFFSDAICEKKAYRLQTVGVYEVGDPSEEVEGASHAEFIRKELHLTAFSMETAQVFEQYRCGDTTWEPDVTTIINKTGCTGLTPSINDCPSEFNLVKRDGDKLTLGDRSESLCERGEWPKRLDAVSLQKTN
jgi:hypothetical protein